MEYKQIIVVRADLKLPKGKMAAQAAHASVEAVLKGLKIDRDKVADWRQAGMKKVVVKVDTEKDLLRVMQEAKDIGLTTALITDAGKTIVAPGTRTCIAIGPDDEDSIDSVTDKLKLM